MQNNNNTNPLANLKPFVDPNEPQPLNYEEFETLNYLSQFMQERGLHETDDIVEFMQKTPEFKTYRQLQNKHIAYISHAMEVRRQVVLN